MNCTNALEPRENEHIIIMAYTQIYKMPIKINGQWLNFNVLFNILMKIEEESRINSILPIKKRVSLLTSENRDIWNQGRNLLLKQGTPT